MQTFKDSKVTLILIPYIVTVPILWLQVCCCGTSGTSAYINIWYGNSPSHSNARAIKVTKDNSVQLETF